MLRDGEYVVIEPTGMHQMADSEHIRNFVRYLFSVTRRHPTIETTRHNYITEYERRPSGGSRCVAGYFNDDPKVLLADFMRRRFAEIDDRDIWVDDLFYMAFILPDLDGNLFSNIVEIAPKSDTGRLSLWDSEDQKAMEMAYDHQGGQAEFVDFVGGAILKGRDRILLMDRASPGQRRAIERRLHEILHETVGGEVAIMVTHRDQPSHNEGYHIHRIRRRLPGEEPGVTDDMIAQHNREHPYPADIERNAARRSGHESRPDTSRGVAGR